MLKLFSYYRGSHCSRFDFVTLLYCPCLVNFFVEKMCHGVDRNVRIQNIKICFPPQQSGGNTDHLQS